MSSMTQGMNIDEVRRLAADLRRIADDLDQYSKMLNRAVSCAVWSGEDARRYKGEWWPRHRGELRKVSAALRGFGDSASNNADEQERASGLGTSGNNSSPNVNDGGVHPTTGSAWKLFQRLGRSAPIIGDAAFAVEAGYYGVLMSKADFEAQIALWQYGAGSPEYLHAAREADFFRNEIIYGGVDMMMGKATIYLEVPDALAEYFFGTGDHSDLWSSKTWAEYYLDAQ